MAANLCFGDCFLNSVAPFLRASLLENILEPYPDPLHPPSKSFPQVPCLNNNIKPPYTIARISEAVQKDPRRRKDCVYTAYHLNFIRLIT